MYTVDYFIEKFEKIPESRWCIDVLHNEHDQHCALGHCGPGGCEEEEGKGLLKLIRKYHDFTSIADVNDGRDKRYPQPTPKQRILAALYDAKKLQDKDKPKEEETFKPVEIKSEFIPVTFKEIQIPEHSIN